MCRYYFKKEVYVMLEERSGQLLEERSGCIAGIEECSHSWNRGADNAGRQ
jgi:hypothetical protein